MLLRRSFQNPRALIQIGFLALVLANLSLRFLHATPSFPEDAKDVLTGFLFGVAIAAMLVGVHRRGCRPA
jgi:hypothetical protein